MKQTPFSIALIAVLIYSKVACAAPVSVEKTSEANGVAEPAFDIPPIRPPGQPRELTADLSEEEHEVLDRAPIQLHKRSIGAEEKHAFDIPPIRPLGQPRGLTADISEEEHEVLDRAPIQPPN